MASRQPQAQTQFDLMMQIATQKTQQAEEEEPTTAEQDGAKKSEGGDVGAFEQFGINRYPTEPKK